MSRHLKAVATSTLNQKQSRHQLVKNLRSRHHHLKKEGRDISQMSRHQKSRKEVATSFSCRNTSCIEKKVATTPSCREINSEDLRSRHQSDVATSVRCRDISQMSRHQSDVATLVVKKRGSDKIKLSRHQFLQRHVATK